jgi:hypothetical protein
MRACEPHARDLHVLLFKTDTEQLGPHEQTYPTLGKNSQDDSFLRSSERKSLRCCRQRRSWRLRVQRSRY